jgi:Protein of unknown function (DUF3263)
MLALAARADQDRGPMGLSARDRAIIDLERAWRHLARSKSSEIRVRFRISPSRYYELLNTLLDDPDAYEYDPLTVKRTLRLRNDRRRLRLEGRRADPGSR